MQPIDKFKETLAALMELSAITQYGNVSEYKEKIPFVNPAPIDEAESKKQKKQKEGMKKQPTPKGEE